MDRTPISQIRKRILEREGKSTPASPEKPARISDLPDEYPKTDKMKYLEAKYNLRIEKVIFFGSLSDAQAALHWEVDRSTISRWREHIKKYFSLTFP